VIGSTSASSSLALSLGMVAPLPGVNAGQRIAADWSGEAEAGDASCVLARPSCQALPGSIAGAPERNDPSTKRPDHGPQGHSTELRCRSRRGATRTSKVRYRVPSDPVRQCAEQSAATPWLWGRRSTEQRPGSESSKVGRKTPQLVTPAVYWLVRAVKRSCGPWPEGAPWQTRCQREMTSLRSGQTTVHRGTPSNYAADPAAARFEHPN
jgi:hypothetical protein